LQEVFQARKVQVESRTEVEVELRKEEEVKLQWLVRLQNARFTAEPDSQIRLPRRTYARDLMDQVEHSKALKVRGPVIILADSYISFLNYLKDCDTNRFVI
jgi:hypothetical protein